MNESTIYSLNDYHSGIAREVDALRGFAHLLASATSNDIAQEFLSGETLDELDGHTKHGPVLVSVALSVMIEALVRKIDERDIQMRKQLGEVKAKKTA